MESAASIPIYVLLEAKRLLRYSDLPVTEIAYRLNFEDPSYFSRFFKKYTGFSPSEFREQP
jgi:AraC family transcriptional regulator, transcriptional activator of pobA